MNDNVVQLLFFATVIETKGAGRPELFLELMGRATWVSCVLLRFCADLGTAGNWSLETLYSNYFLIAYGLDDLIFSGYLLNLFISIRAYF